jgi:hypothetical protein
MKDFVEKNTDIVFRYWLRKRMWTPYEMELKDKYQSDLEDEEASYGYLVEAINLGHDWLIGISEDKIADYISYYRLSEIDLAISKKDQE